MDAICMMFALPKYAVVANGYDSGALEELSSNLAALTAVEENDEGLDEGVSSAQRAAVVEDHSYLGDLVEDLVIDDCLAEGSDMDGSAKTIAGIALPVLAGQRQSS